ncbi:MAG: hypothetical protein M3Y27_08570 [Acidobacteriota bacterium]|nr:hypothetical protein [Acidobacteriota bacterium]
MLGLITYEGILALTHQRLHNFNIALTRKIKSGRAVNDVDKQIRSLAASAADLMTRPPSIGADPDARPLASGLSRFAALGAAGFNITRYAAYFAPGQRWLADTMRRGNPDPDREMVLARSTDFLLRFWNSVQGQIPADHPEDLDKMRAYVLGHACAIAGDVVSAPFFNALEMQPGTPALRKLSIDEIANTLDLLAAQKLFRHPDARNRTWSEWFPAANEIPSQFYDAYKTALEGAYGAGARRTGSHAFEQSRSHEEPPLRGDLIRDGYSSFRSVLEHNYAWSMGDWALATVWIFIPPLICLPVAAALPQGKQLFIDPTLAGADKEKAWFQLLTLPLAASALFPIVYAIYLLAHSYLGAAPDAILGLVVSIVNLIAAVFYFSTLGSDVSAAVRWLLFFIVPLAGLLVHTIYVFARGTTDPQRRLLALGSLLPVVTSIVFVLAYAIFLRFAVQGLQQDGAGSGAFWGLFILWLAILVTAWLILSWRLSLQRVPDATQTSVALSGNLLLRLFDQATLFTDPSHHNSTIADQFFPTNRRPLLKLWWEGPKPLFIRSDRSSLVFSKNANGGQPDDQTVLAPIAPLKAVTYGQFLTRAVKDDAGNFTGKLKTELVDAADLDYELPAGETFSDHGDDKTTQADHDTEAAKFRPLPTTRDQAYVLFHAPRGRLATFFGKAGPFLADDAPAAALNGAGTISSAGTIVTGIGTTFWTFFRPGDVIATLPPNPVQARVIVSIQSDTQLTTVTPFAPVLPAPAVRTFQRRGRDRTSDVPGTGTINGMTGVVAAAPPALATGANVPSTAIAGAGGTVFDQFFMPGDTIRALPVNPVAGGPAFPSEERTVASVASPNQLTVDVPFSSLVGLATPYQRVGNLTRQGLAYVADGDDFLFTGASLMDRAADLGILLTMGFTSHLLDEGDRTPLATGTAGGLNKAYQVLRNWNLDERRVNEWRMLVVGNAVTEKAGTPAHGDPMQPDFPSGWSTPAADAEPVTRQLGWIPLLHKWAEVARRPGVDSSARNSFLPGDPTNRNLSRAMAFLLDLPDPGA